jgi:L-cysteine/cystine lyase
MVVCDGAQALGQIALDVRALAIDFYAGPGQKWLCGPDGTGVLFVRRDRIAELAPSRPAYWAAATYDMAGNFEEYTGDARRFESSGTNGGVWAGLSAAIATTREIGFDEVEERSTRLASYAVGRLMTVPGVRLISPREGPGVSGLVCFRLGDLAPDQVTATLWERQRITLGGREASRRMHYTESTRISTAFFNAESDVDAVIDALNEIVAKGPIEDVKSTGWWKATHDDD